jgi:hypothetical protein
MNFTLELKHNVSKWVKIGTNQKNEPIELYIGYLDSTQEQNLEKIKNRDVPKSEYVNKTLEYVRYIIRCAIKDWKGVIDSEGNILGCKLVNNELEHELWWALVKDDKRVIDIFNLIDKEIQFTSTDKKK